MEGQHPFHTLKAYYEGYIPPPIEPARLAVIRFAAEQNAGWTSIFGVEQAAALNSRPFLALSAPSGDFRHDLPRLCRYLFMISPRKPRGLLQDFYVALSPSGADSSESRVAYVEPPLPLAANEELYIYTAPVPDLATVSMSKDSDAHNDAMGIGIQRHCLSDESYAQFLQYAKEDLYKFDHLFETFPTLKPTFTEDEQYQPGWYSWNGTRPTDSGLQNRPPFLHFEEAAFGHLDLTEPPKLFSDLAVYQQLTEEYSWWGVTNTILWVRKARRRISSKSGAPALDLIDGIDAPGDVPTLSDERRPALAELSKLRSAMFEDPNCAQTTPGETGADQQALCDIDEDREDVDWDWPFDNDSEDEAVPDLERIPTLAGSVIHSTTNLKGIVFDWYGALFNREGAIQDALIKVIPTVPNMLRSACEELLSFFIEYEASRYRADPHADPEGIIQDTLRDVARDAGITSIPDDTLREATRVVLRPFLHNDALPTLQSLHAKGYTLMFLCPADIPTLSDHIHSVLPPDIIQIFDGGRSSLWYNSDASLYSDLLDMCRTLHAGTSPDAFAVVTASPYRVIEPAHTAGFPTVLISRPTELESKVILKVCPPTLMIEQLVDLVEQLSKISKAADQTASSQEGPVAFPAFRIRLYQTAGHIGHKENVFRAFHLITGSRVAIKVELQLGEACLLQYEAGVHRLLQGHPGIPRIRWDGKENNCHIIIMDQLGPNIGHLRQFCRGTLTLRTVLILAEQMLTLVEYAHSKGVVLRDIKPENFVMGSEDHDPHVLYLIDFGLARLFVDPETGQHIPSRDGLSRIGTARYSSYNTHFGREQSRRDDIEALGISLLSLIHAVLPWDTVHAPDQYSKYLHTGEMKEGKAMKELLTRSPEEFTAYFEHCRGLAFDAMPDYMLLKILFRKRMAKEGWTYDPMACDWMGKTTLEYGTVEPEEYKFVVLPRNREFVKGRILPDWKWKWLSDKME